MSLPWSVKVGIVLAGIVLGVNLTALVSYWIEYVLEGPAVRNCVETGRIGTEPLREFVAKSIGEQCREEIARKNITARFERSHSWPVVLAARLIFLLLDPIRLVLVVVFSTGSVLLLLRFVRIRT